MVTRQWDGPVPIHPLVFTVDGDEVTVGRRDIDVYAVLPVEGAELLRRLAAGETPAAVDAWYRETYGESVDLDDFLDSLRNLGFLRDTGDETEDGCQPAGTGSPVRFQRFARALFSPPAAAVYAVIVVAAILVMVTDPALAPRPSNVLFSPYLTMVELTVMVGSFPLILLHEIAHVLAGRRLGLATRIRLSQRFYYLVLETAMDGLVSVPRRQRWLPMLGGIMTDVLVISVLTLSAAVERGDGTLGSVGRVALALAFATVVRITWQFYFFLRTDLYYLVSTALGCVDLHGAARARLAETWARARGRPVVVDPDRWHLRDRQAARWYAPLMVAGYTASAVVLLLVALPIGAQVLEVLVDRLLHGADAPLEQWDTLVLLALNLGNLVLAGVLANRRRRLHTRRAT